MDMRNKNTESLAQQMGINGNEHRSRNQFIDFTDTDSRLLKELAPLIEQHATSALRSSNTTSPTDRAGSCR